MAGEKAIEFLRNSQRGIRHLGEWKFYAVCRAKAVWKLKERALLRSRSHGEALKAQRNSAVASLGQAEAQRDQAKLNLSYTKIPAPVDGLIAQRSVQVGNYVSVGAPDR